MRVADIRFSGMCPVKAFLGGRPRADSSALKNLRDLHMAPRAAFAGATFRALKLPGD